MKRSTKIVLLTVAAALFVAGVVYYGQISRASTNWGIGYSRYHEFLFDLPLLPYLVASTIAVWTLVPGRSWWRIPLKVVLSLVATGVMYWVTLDIDFTYMNPLVF